MGYLAAALFLGKIIADPLWGLLRDKIGDKKTITICAFLNLVNTVLLSKCSTLTHLIMTMFFTGLVSAMFIVASGFSGWIETQNRDYLNMWIYIVATAGSLMGPFTGAYLFDHVGEPKIGWTWIPIGSMLMLAALVFLFAFRDFDDSLLIEESNYSKLEDSGDELEELDAMNSLSISGINDEDNRIKKFEPLSPNIPLKANRFEDINSSFDGRKGPSLKDQKQKSLKPSASHDNLKESFKAENPP